MNFRNPQFNAAGGIDLELEVSPGEFVPHSVEPGSDLEVLALADGPAPYAPPTLTEAEENAWLASIRPSLFMAKPAFASFARDQGWITNAQLIAWGETGALPSWVGAAIDAQSADAAADARFTIAEARTVQRNSPLLAIIQAALAAQGTPVSDEFLDRAFGRARGLIE